MPETKKPAPKPAEKPTKDSALAKLEKRVKALEKLVEHRLG